MYKALSGRKKKTNERARLSGAMRGARPGLGVGGRSGRVRWGAQRCSLDVAAHVASGLLCTSMRAINRGRIINVVHI